MDQVADRARAGQPAPLRISRTFPAPREQVFKAWGSAHAVKRWFCPEIFSAPEARVEMRPGGPFEVCMRAPDGTEHWTRGVFAEVSPPERLVLDLHVTDANGRAQMSAFTEATFTEVPGGTRLDIVQTYTPLTPEAAQMIGGAPVGWGQTLDRLEAEVARAEAGEPTRSVVHGVFHLERTYPAPVERVWRALSDEKAKAKWFVGGPEWTPLERSMDFRVGGRERAKGRWASGLVTDFDAIYQDIVPLERLVYTYVMHLNETKISVSLATLELKPAGPGHTTLQITEQGAFLDGYEDGGSRQHGTGLLLDRIGASLQD